MKYLIENTENHTLGEINDYFKKELMQISNRNLQYPRFINNNNYIVC